MAKSSSIISLRLPDETRQRLDEMAARARRPRSYIIQRAIELHMEEAAREDSPPPAKADRFAVLRSMAGAGAKLSGGQTKEEIDDHIRWLRGDD